MIKLTKDTTAEVILTLTEKETIFEANYLFVFESRVSNEKVKFVLLNVTDESEYKDRYNLFNIVVNDYFADAENGWYKYTVYEQESTTNTDETLTGGILETGLMFLEDGTEITTTTYDNPTTYTTYDAQ